MVSPVTKRGFATVAVLGSAVWGGCWPGGAAFDRPLRVVISGDTAGWIVPCGCTSNQSGGLPRRGTYVNELRSDGETIVADAGGAAGGTSLYDRLKFEAILKGELAMGIAAHNIGSSETALGPDYLRGLAQKLDVPLVSANVFDKQGTPLAEPLRIVQAAGRRVALVGVLSQRYATAELQVTAPRQAVSDALRAVAGRYDVVVVLAYLPDEELQQLAETLPEADVIVGGPTGQPIQPKQIGPVLLASATRQGKFLARFQAPAAGPSGRWTGSIVELDGRFADDPDQVAVVEHFREELTRRNLKPGDTSFVKSLPSAQASYRIAGTSSCADCHRDDHRLWLASRHAQAWNSLKTKGAEFDPECQRCHTSGYGVPGGFESVGNSSELVNVGCESCHGPSQGHAGEPKTRTAYFGQANSQCRACHDQENSPKFADQEYWARIRHGTSPAATKKAE